MIKQNNLSSLTIAQLSSLIKKKEVSPVEVVKTTIERMEDVEPHINAFITIDNKIMLQMAEQTEREILAGDYKGPLHGIPIGLKDMIQTEDYPTTMGSEIFALNQPKNDAYVVRKLKAAGAVIAGKHNTHQFAYGPTGDRSYYGPVHNPYDLNKMTGGSSSGSAAAVATGMNFGAIGTDTGGSVRIPASFCGIVGMKPTYGRFSKNGVFPLSWNLDHVGPMTRTVKDNAIILNAIQGYDRQDVNSVFSEQEDFLLSFKSDLKGIKVGVPRDYFYDHLNSEIRLNIESQIHLLTKLGADIIDVKIDGIETFDESQRTILASDAFALHKERLEQHPTLWDDEVKERLYTGKDVKGYAYSNALLHQQRLKESFYTVLKEVDLLITPTTPILPIDINSRHVDIEQYNQEHIRWSILKLTSPTNLTGLPSISIPSGLSKEGLPMGTQLIGRYFDEALLYQVSYILEQEIAFSSLEKDVNILV